MHRFNTNDDNRETYLLVSNRRPTVVDPTLLLRVGSKTRKQEALKGGKGKGLHSARGREGLKEGGEDGWSVCMPNGGWRTTGQDDKRDGRSAESTGSPRNLRQSHGIRCKRPFLLSRLRIEQRLNGCGRNRNEGGREEREGTGGWDGGGMCLRTGRGKRAYELIFINVSEREGEREREVASVDASGRSAEKSTANRPMPLRFSFGAGKNGRGRCERAPLSFLLCFLVCIRLLSRLPFVVCLFEASQSWLIPRVLAKGVQGGQIRGSEVCRYPRA